MNVPYSVIKQDTDSILRSGTCATQDFYSQAGDGEEVILGRGCDVNDKVVVDAKGNKVIAKRSKEDRASRRATMIPKQPDVPQGEQLASISNDQLQEIIKRIEKLEGGRG